MKYDDASWHFGADDFPELSPEEYGGLHIALFLKWCFKRGWAGELHVVEEPLAVEAVISDRMTATDFLFKYCDGKLTTEDFNDEGNSFAKQYYGERGRYLHDFMERFGETAYKVSEIDFDYEAYSALLERKLKSNRLKRPWWQPF